MMSATVNLSNCSWCSDRRKRERERREGERERENRSWGLRPC
jgi:hypothetical protein